MKILYPIQKWFFKAAGVLLFAGVLFIIHSCKKDLTKQEQTLSDPEVIKVKDWYQQSFPAYTATHGTKNGLSTLSTSSGTPSELDQYIDPEWVNTNKYKRFSKDVYEIPLNPDNKFAAALKDPSTSKNYGDKGNSKTSFLILKDDAGYHAYVMYVIADSTYLKGDLTKLARTAYNKRDTDFSGTVLYFTPKGAYLSGYKYFNGHLVSPSGSTSATNKTVQSMPVNGKKVASVTTTCDDWYWVIRVNGVIVSTTYIFTTCTTVDNGDGSDNGGGGGGGGTPPAQCAPASTSMKNIRVTDDGDQTPSDGFDGGDGFPSPGTSTACVVPQKKSIQAVLDSLVNNDDTFLFDCDSIQLLKLAAYNNYGSMYQNIAQFIPSNAVKSRVISLDQNLTSMAFSSYNLQNLDNATGPVINSDFFPVNISSLPQGMTMSSLVEYFRLNMNTFASGGGASFYPYADTHIDDTQYFNSPGAQSVGSLVHIQMSDDGTVVESGYQSNASGSSFTFTTMTSPLDFNHPVSGNRQFGIYPDTNNPGSYTFYTMGVDRTSDWFFATVNFDNMVFNGADKLWSTMQKNMINYINQNGGQAQFYPNHKYVARPDYDVAKDYLNGNITLDQLKHKIGC